MQAFEYTAPGSAKEAAGLLSSSWGEADVLAGGTDLLSLMKERIHTPKRVVSLKNVRGLSGIAASGGGVQIGATATLDALLGDAAIAKSYPSLIQAAEGVTSPQMLAESAHNACGCCHGMTFTVNGVGRPCSPDNRPAPSVLPVSNRHHRFKKHVRHSSTTFP